MDSSTKNVCARQQCVVQNCKGPTRDPQRLYRFPIQREHASPMINSLIVKRKLCWIEAVNRKDLLDDKIILHKICSDHFVTGTPSPSHEVNNLDWIPSLNLNIEAEKEIDQTKVITISPVKEIPVKEIPVKEISVKEIPVKEIPIKEISVKEIPVKEIPPIKPQQLSTVPIINAIKETPTTSQNGLKFTPIILKSKLKRIQSTAQPIKASTQNISSKTLPILFQKIKPITNNYRMETLSNGNKVIRFVPMKFNTQSLTTWTAASTTKSITSSSLTSSSLTSSLTSAFSSTSTTLTSSSKPTTLTAASTTKSITSSSLTSSSLTSAFSSTSTTLTSSSKPTTLTAASTTKSITLSSSLTSAFSSTSTTLTSSSKPTTLTSSSKPTTLSVTPATTTLKLASTSTPKSTTTTTTATKTTTKTTTIKSLPLITKSFKRRFPDKPFVRILPKVEIHPSNQIINVSDRTPPPNKPPTNLQKIFLKDIDLSKLKLMLNKKQPTETPLSSSIIKLKNIPNLSILKTLPTKSNAININTNNNNNNAGKVTITGTGTFDGVGLMADSSNVTVVKHMNVPRNVMTVASDKRTVATTKIGSSSSSANSTLPISIGNKQLSIPAVNRLMMNNKTASPPSLVLFNGVNRYVVKNGQTNNMKLTSNKNNTNNTNNNNNNTNNNIKSTGISINDNKNIKISNIYSAGNPISTNYFRNNNNNKIIGADAIDFIDMTNESEMDNFIDENEERINDLYNSDDNAHNTDNDDNDDDDNDDVDTDNNDNDDYEDVNDDEDDDVIFVDSQNIDTDLENDNEVAFINKKMETKITHANHQLAKSQSTTINNSSIINHLPKPKIIKTYGTAASTIGTKILQRLLPTHKQPTTVIYNNKTFPQEYPIILNYNSNIPPNSLQSKVNTTLPLPHSTTEIQSTNRMPSTMMPALPNIMATIKPIAIPPLKVTNHTIANTTTTTTTATATATNNMINPTTIPTAIIRRCVPKNTALTSSNSNSIPSTLKILPLNTSISQKNSTISTTNNSSTTTTTISTSVDVSSTPITTTSTTTTTTTATTTTATASTTEIPKTSPPKQIPIEKKIIISDSEIRRELSLAAGEFNNSYIKIDQIINKKLYSYTVNLISEKGLDNNLNKNPPNPQSTLDASNPSNISIVSSTNKDSELSSSSLSSALSSSSALTTSSSTLSATSPINTSAPAEKRKGIITIKDYRELMDTSKIRKPNPATSTATPSLAISKVVSLARKPQNKTSKLPRVFTIHPSIYSVATPSLVTPSLATPSLATPSLATPSLATPSVATKQLPVSISNRPFHLKRKSIVATGEREQEEDERKKQIANSKLLREKSKQNLQNLIQMVAQRERTKVPTG